jgi:Cu(I)/Ag(I) efflux system membrane fusion protein
MPCKIVLTAILGFALMVAISGCGSTEPDAPNAATRDAGTEASAHEDMGHGHSAHDHGSSDDTGKTDMEKMKESLADFSEEDRESAMKQHFCPVSGEMLGTMGQPQKVEVQGQMVWICCEGCKDQLLAEPDKYLAKLNN